MTDYNAILATETDPDAPLRSSLFKRLVANPLALAEGDDTAHTAGAAIRLKALQRLVVGDTVRLQDTTTRTNNTTTFVTLLSAGIVQVGQVRIKAEHRSPSGTSNAELLIRRTRNGSVTTIVTFQTASTSFVARSQDVDVLPGDLISVLHRHSSGSPSFSEARNVQLCTDVGTAPVPMDNFGLWTNLP